MTFLAEPKAYAPAEFATFVEALTWREWRPRFITLHNTGVPSLATWMDPVHSAMQRIVSQKHYERDILGWHSGVHLFVAQDLIWNLCDLTQVGVSVSCWNHLTLGIEMVGDYAAESFESGAGRASPRERGSGPRSFTSQAWIAAGWLQAWRTRAAFSQRMPPRSS